MNKLKWKIKYLSDKSGFWYEADVKPLGWTYVIDDTTEQENYQCFLFVSKCCGEESRISKKKFKSLEKAQQECEKHLKMVYDGLKKIFN